MSGLIGVIGRQVLSEGDPRRRLRVLMPMGMLLLLLATGCTSVRGVLRAESSPSRTRNAYQWPGPLPAELRRVALLPLTSSEAVVRSGPTMSILASALMVELDKLKRFELVAVTPSELRAWTGRASWQRMDALPADLLERLQQQTDCDAVLFAELTHYHGYPPLVVGWHFALVSIKDGRTLWAFDEVFDAMEPSVAAAARNFQSRHDALPRPLADARSILISPSRFGRFTAHTSFATLPPR